VHSNGIILKLICVIEYQPANQTIFNHHV